MVGPDPTKLPSTDKGSKANRKGKKPEGTPPGIRQPRILQTIKPRAIEWLWKDWIPSGKLTMLDGDPGLGKSTVLLDLAARITTHGKMPDGWQGPVGHVLILSAEDDPADTIRPRLELAGADLQRVVILEELNQIEAALNEFKPKLLIIDPLAAYLQCHWGRDAQVRQALAPLKRLMEAANCALVCQRHLNKSGGTKAVYRGGGSIAFLAAARSALLIAKEPGDSPWTALAQVKCNRAKEVAGLRFRLIPKEVEIDGKPDTLCSVSWGGSSPYKPEQLLHEPTWEEQESQEEKIDKLTAALNLLQHLLKDGKVRSVKEIKIEAKRLDIAWRTVERASKKLKVSLVYNNPEHDNEHTWALPGQSGEMSS